MPRTDTRQHWTRALGHAAAYGAWVAGAKLLALTGVTWFMISAGSDQKPRFQDVSDAYASSELMVMGAAALLYVILLRALNPVTSATVEEIFTPHRFEKRFVPGFFHGAMIAVGVTLAFLASGHYRYLGTAVPLEDAPLVVASTLMRVLALGALVYCEEFVFRHRILHLFRRAFPELGAASLTALLYCAVKALQFDLGLLQLGTLFVASMTLALRSAGEGDFVRGAGFWSGLLIVLHPFLSLPLFGCEFQGLLLVRYEPSLEGEATTSRFLTGGIGGPLSSLSLQILLASDFLAQAFRLKKTLWGVPNPKLR